MGIYYKPARFEFYNLLARGIRKSSYQKGFVSIAAQKINLEL